MVRLAPAGRIDNAIAIDAVIANRGRTAAGRDRTVDYWGLHGIRPPRSCVIRSAGGLRRRIGPADFPPDPNGVRQESYFQQLAPVRNCSLRVLAERRRGFGTLGNTGPTGALAAGRSALAGPLPRAVAHLVAGIGTARQSVILVRIRSPDPRPSQAAVTRG